MNRATRREVDAVLESYGMKKTSVRAKSYRGFFEAPELMREDFSDTTPATIEEFSAFIGGKVEQTERRELAEANEQAEREAMREEKRARRRVEKQAAIDDMVKTGASIPQAVHAGRCVACHRKLTSPVSIALGIGPDCLEQAIRARVTDPENAARAVLKIRRAASLN